LRYIIVKAFGISSNFILAKMPCPDALMMTDIKNFDKLLHEAGFMMGMGSPVEYEIKLVNEEDFKREGCYVGKNT